jgi:hypothetical protein
VIETPRELAIRLLHENRDDVARGVHKVVSRINPRWASVEREAFAQTAARQLEAIEKHLRGGNPDELLRYARDSMRIRKLSGFSAPDFNIALHAYLPVIRKAFLARAPNMKQALGAFDVVESVLLPLAWRFIEAAARVDEITTPDAQPAFQRPFEELSVNDELPEFMRSDYDDDDDPTNPNGRVPPAGRRRS